MADQSNIQSAASKSIRPFRSSEEYLEAMKEDLAEWLNALYDLDVQADNFMDVLETGSDLCQHANNVNRIAQEFLESQPAPSSLRVPRKEVVFQSKNVAPGSFVARDNVSNFIQWCRQELGIQDVLMFETNDLVLRKNEKNFVLCLLEVARKGSKFGMLAPVLIQMEEEIEEEIMRHRDAAYGGGGGGGFEAAAAAPAAEKESALGPKRTQRMTLGDLKNLDELVREILGHCTCPSQFPMVKVSEGKYKVGDSNALIFVRVLRSHVMVRVGGGWDTLEHYLDKHDPCRCASLSHRLTQPRGLAFSPQKMAAPGSQPSSPGGQRRAEASGPKRPSAGGDGAGGHPKGLRPVKGPGDPTPPRPASGAHQRAASPRPRRFSGDSDSSASSVQSAKRSEDALSAQRRDPGRRVSEGSVLQSRPKKPTDGRTATSPRPSPRTRRRGLDDERGRARTMAAAAVRTRSQDPVLLISRGKDGQHSWVKEEAAAAGSGRSKGPSRSPSLTKRRGSLPAPKMADRVQASQPRPSPAPDTFAQELERLARHFRTPLRLDPNQEQQLYRRLEEEFLANSQMMEDRDEDPPPPSLGARPTQNAPETAAPDSAYCSSSSSSSSLNFFTKYGPKDENKSNANASAAAAQTSSETAPFGFPNGSDAWERRTAALSSSSDESNGGAGPSDAVSAAKKRVPCLYAPKPRADSQPDKTPSKIPTPLSYKAASGRPAAASPNTPRRRPSGPWTSFQNAFAAFAEPSRGPTADTKTADEGS